MAAKRNADLRALLNLKKRVTYFPKADGLTVLSKREIQQDMRDILNTAEKPELDSSDDNEYLAEAQEDYARRKRRRIPEVAENCWVDELLYYNWRLAISRKEAHEIVKERHSAKRKYRAVRGLIISQIRQSFKDRKHQKEILSRLTSQLEKNKQHTANLAKKVKVAENAAAQEEPELRQKLIDIIKKSSDEQARNKMQELLKRSMSDSKKNSKDAGATSIENDDDDQSEILQFYSSFVEKVPRNMLLTLSPIVETNLKCLVPGKLSDEQWQHMSNTLDVTRWESDKNKLNRTEGNLARLQHQHSILQERSRQQKKQLASRRLDNVTMVAQLNELRAKLKATTDEHNEKIAALLDKSEKALAAQKKEIVRLREENAELSRKR